MDFDDAYANAQYIPDGMAYPDRWAHAAEAFRNTTKCKLDVPYGASPRERFDLFYPTEAPRGLVVFVHGGYWLRFDRSFWSHFAAGPLAQGWAVAMPSYDLCPDVSITQIGAQISLAITAAAKEVSGPIALVGHSAGGQLVARMPSLCSGAGWFSRLARIVPISPVADLAPLMQTSMNTDLKLTTSEVLRESPVHHPAPVAPVTVWVGGQERPVFLEQAYALGDAWECPVAVPPDAHHFNVIDALIDPNGQLVAEICASCE